MCTVMRKEQNLTHAQELVTLRTGRAVADLLREMYVRDGKPQTLIAEELGVSRNTVAMWLRQFAIDRPEVVA